MKKSIYFSTAVLLFIFMSSFAFAQDWETYEASDFNLQFQIPSNWTTKTGIKNEVAYVESISQGKTMELYLYIYKDSKVSTRELLDQAIKEQNAKLKTTQVQEEDLNGLHCFWAEATTTFDDVEYGMYIMAATYGDNNYVTYIYTKSDQWDANLKTIDKIWYSFKPLKK